MNKLKIYLDCCCFSRPFDDLSQDKIRFECEAVLAILKACENGIWNIFGSDILDDEISRIPNAFNKLKILMLYSSTSIKVEINDEIINRAKELQRTANIKPYDALHLASAEYGGADIFLTTDRKFLNRAEKSNVKIRVSNPAIWIMEVMYNDLRFE